MDEKEEVSKQNEGRKETGKEKKNGGNWFVRFILMNLSKKAINIIIVVVICSVVLGGIGLGLRTYFSVQSKTTKLKFEDIGELATQVAYTTNVNVENKDQKFLWTSLSIPFTQSKYVFSYGTIIKAGIDFEAIDYDVNESSKVINVQLPEVKVLSTEIDLDSLEVYLEDESIFTQIKLEDQNESMIELKDQAQQDAIANGLLDNAEENAKMLITGFFAGVYDLDEYTIDFND